MDVIRNLVLSLFILLLLSPKEGTSQTVPQWASFYSDPPWVYNGVGDFKADAQGNSYIISNFTNNSGFPHTRMLKYNNAGSLVWTDTIRNCDYYTRIVLDKMGNPYFLGRSSNGSGNVCMRIIKYNLAGSRIWSRYFNSGFHHDDYPVSVGVDDSLNVFVTGQSPDSTAGSPTDFMTIKYNSLGVLQWANRYHSLSGSNDSPFAITLDKGHNIYVTGHSLDTINGSMLTLKYSQTGSLIWARRFHTGFGEESFSIQADSHENIYVGGTRYGNSGWSDYLCVKYDSTGTVIWSALYDPISITSPTVWNVPIDMKIDSMGNVYMTGTQYQGNGPLDDFCTVKFNSNGGVSWAKSYNSGYYVDPTSLAIGKNGLVYVTGRSMDSAYGYANVATTIVYDTSGARKSILKYPDVRGWGNYDYPFGKMAMDSLDNIYISGPFQFSGFQGLATIKYGYSQLTGISELIRNDNGQPVTIYPNPFSSEFTISPGDGFSLQENEFALFDLTGKQIHRERIESSIFQFARGYLAPGVYFFQIKNKDGEVIYGKVIAE